MAFEVLAEPNRRRILELLRVEERPVGDLVAELSVSQPAVSKHLRILREAGLVEVRSDAHAAPPPAGARPGGARSRGGRSRTGACGRPASTTSSATSTPFPDEGAA